MSIANTAQAEHWNTGPGVAHWVANQARYDRMHAPFTALILEAAALRPGGNVLDVGCGCGGTTLAAARLVAPGQALGLDLSGPMLARARSDAEAAGLANVTFQQGDAQVESLEPAGFEVVISRFGVMFFADPVAAFRNLVAALRPGGRLAMAVWAPIADNLHWQIPFDIAVRRLGPPAPTDPRVPGPLAYSDAGYFRSILERAGLADVAVTPKPFQVIGRSAKDEAEVAAERGPSGRLLEEKKPDQATRQGLVAEFEVELTAELADFLGEARVLG